jgi:uncharacterized membrane protein
MQKAEAHAQKIRENLNLSPENDGVHHRLQYENTISAIFLLAKAGFYLQAESNNI